MLNEIYFSYQSYMCEHLCKIYTEVGKKCYQGRNIQVNMDTFCYSTSMLHVTKFSVRGTLAEQQHKQ